MATENRLQRGPKHIGDIIEDLFRQPEMERQIRASLAVRCWEAVAGSGYSAHAAAVALNQGTLIVEVDNSVWMHRLQTQVSHLKGRLNQELKSRDPEGEPIRDIRFRLRQEI